MDRNNYVNSSLLEIGFLKKMIQKMPVFDFSSPLSSACCDGTESVDTSEKKISVKPLEALTIL